MFNERVEKVLLRSKIISSSAVRFYLYTLFYLLLFIIFFIVPDDFNWDPATKSIGEPTRRPELRYASIEFIAPSEYMVFIYIYFLTFGAF